MVFTFFDLAVWRVEDFDSFSFIGSAGADAVEISDVSEASSVTDNVDIFSLRISVSVALLVTGDGSCLSDVSAGGSVSASSLRLSSVSAGSA